MNHDQTEMYFVDPNTKSCSVLVLNPADGTVKFARNLDTISLWNSIGKL